MKTKSNTVNTVQVNGKEVLDFTPQYDSQSAIVSLSVIQRLAGLLPITPIHKIVEDMRDKLYILPDNHTIEDYLKLLQDELDFHTTINLLTMYEDNPNINDTEKIKGYINY